jgi:hypothetical protein
MLVLLRQQKLGSYEELNFSSGWKSSDSSNSCQQHSIMENYHLDEREGEEMVTVQDRAQ